MKIRCDKRRHGRQYFQYSKLLMISYCVLNVVFVNKQRTVFPGPTSCDMHV